eukprot:9317659-Heterocapsa_arctica.AAC.1
MKKYNILVRKGKEHSTEGRKGLEAEGRHQQLKNSKMEALGGSAQMADRLKEAQKAWGGLWEVEAEDLPELENQPMEIITEGKIRRVVNRL